MPRVALLGTGRWGTKVLRDLRLAGCDVETLGRGDAGEERAVDGVVIATPAPTHAELAGRALTLGVPVFVEKPLATSADEAAALADRGAGRLFVMDKWRWHPAVRLMAELLRDGRIGAPRELRTRRLTTAVPHADTDATLTLALHDLAVTLEVLGVVPPARAAEVRRRDGRRVALDGRLGAGPVVHITVDAEAPQRRTELRLAGDELTAVLADPYAPSLELHEPGGGRVVERLALTGPAPLAAELQAFADHLRGGPPPRSTAADHVLLLRRLEDLWRVARAP